MRMTLLNPATDILLWRDFHWTPWHQLFLKMDSQKFDNVVFQPIGTLQFAHGIVGHLEVAVYIRALPLPPDFVGELLPAPIFNLDELCAGLVGDTFHLLDERVRLFIGDRRTNNE